ncbi:DddA-like double-stranded DNA deaminase toxin, partial [Streptomyces sp. NPDC001663]|uniref:DddA-like double-stranded DNA deaminase toxin n=1 Tax=Streptomyces sp. NPDC001663 TaxID=3364597 RepID=UPI0036C98231
RPPRLQQSDRTSPHIQPPRPPTRRTYAVTALEAQTAAAMERTGIMEGTLYLSGDYICGKCSASLADWLPKGASLEVKYMDSNGAIQTIPFTGK